MSKKKTEKGPTISRELLLQDLEAVTPGLASRENIEQSVHFVFKDGRVMTFNDEIACSTTLQADLKMEGAVVAAPLLSLLRKLQGDDVEAKVSKGALRLTSGKQRGAVRMEQDVLLPIDCIEKVDPDDWTALPDAEEFRRAVGLVQTCAGPDPAKHPLDSVHIGPKSVEATDNFQIARYDVKTGIKSALVRKPAMRAIADTAVEEFAQTDEWLHFRTPDGLVFHCRKSREKFPNLAKYLEPEGEKLSLPSGLAGAVDKATIFVGDAGDLVSVIVGDGKVKVEGRGPDGWFREWNETDYEGDPLEFALAPRLLMEIIKRSSVIHVATGRLVIASDDGRWRYATCTKVGRADDED